MLFYHTHTHTHTHTHVIYIYVYIYIYIYIYRCKYKVNVTFQDFIYQLIFSKDLPKLQERYFKIPLPLVAELFHVDVKKDGQTQA